MYEDRENTKWFSQTLLTHKDKLYGTDGYLRISISTNTEDYKFFNPPALIISIQNNYQKNYHINYHNACDLLQTLNIIKSQSNANNSEIQRKYQKNMILYIKLFVESNNNDSVVDIRILSNETDFTKIIIPIDIFATFGKCLRYYVENYFNMCNQLLMKSIDSESTNIIQQLPSLIKGISSQIVSQDRIQDDRVPTEEEKAASSKVEATINDLDDFLGSEMENISIPELGENTVINKEKSLVEVDSPFVKHVLKNNLYNLENMINNHALNPAPILSLKKELHNTLDPQIKNDISFMPGIGDDDLKSLLYMTKMFYSTAHINHIINDISLPGSVPVMKYTAKTASSENIELSYDLFLFGIYIKTVRARLEGKSSDMNINKALFHIQLRCFTDVFVFSFLSKDETPNLKSIILNRYKYYNSVGVFDKYKTSLNDFNCPEIKEVDLEAEIDLAINMIIGKVPDINLLHSKANGNFRVPSKNSFSLEQIINEIIPLEVAEKCGKDIKNADVMAEINKNSPISDEIYNFFTKSQTKVKVKKETNRTFDNNLERVINFYSNEIPDQYKKDFLQYMKKQSEIPFDMNSCDFPLDEFGDNVIRALYLWNPVDDPKITSNYKHFQMKIENEIMEKDLILAKIKNEESDKSENDNEWEFLSE